MVKMTVVNEKNFMANKSSHLRSRPPYRDFPSLRNVVAFILQVSGHSKITDLYVIKIMTSHCVHAGFVFEGCHNMGYLTE